MRINFVLPYAGLQGGVRVIATHAEHLIRRGHEVQVISQPQVFSIRHSLKSLLTGNGLPEPEPSYFSGRGIPHRVLETARPVRDDDLPDADVVIATYFTTAAGVQRLSESKGAKSIFIQNYEVPPGKSNAALDATWRMPMHKIVISQWLVDWARDKFGDYAVSHVPNSVDVAQFSAPPRSKNARPTVGLLYSSSPLKGLNTSVKALERIASVLPSVRVVAFGAEHPDIFRSLPNFVEFHYRPKQETLREIYAQCDVWMCGSNIEGFHLPPLEAMACRCPVVSTRCGGPLDIIEQGINGYLVNVKDDEALARWVLHVLTLGPEAWKSMSDAAYRTAHQFTWNDAADLFELALHRAVERAKRGEFLENRDAGYAVVRHSV